MKIGSPRKVELLAMRTETLTVMKALAEKMRIEPDLKRRVEMQHDLKILGGISLEEKALIDKL